MLKSSKKLVVFGAVAVIVAAAALGLVFSFYHNYYPKNIKAAGNDWPVIPSQPMFYNQANFQEAIDFAANIKKQDNIKIIVTPHHLLAARYIASLIKAAGGRRIGRVIIVGPNHNNIGMNSVASALASWQTPFGLTASDNYLVNKFLVDFRLNSHSEIFKNEHSVGAIIPFIKYYYPQASLAPIILDSYANKKEVEAVGEWLDKNSDENDLVVISSDFSHYLDYQTAERKDAVTRKLIEEKNIDKILTLNNDYVDSPASLAVALFLAQKKDLTAEIIYHDNSFNFLTEKPMQTTSYFGIAFVSR